MEYAFVGYGSLMSHKSLRKTISDKKFKPVIVKGYKRIFNVKDYKTDGSDVLNLEKSKENYLNGVFFHVNEEELRKIKIREDDYELQKVNVYDFNTKKRINKCFLVVDHYLFLDRKKGKPNRSYFVLCREAAYHISKKFGVMWDNTTYVLSGEKVFNWIKNNKKYDTINYSSTLSTFIA